jgi:hypothetical protein
VEAALRASGGVVAHAAMALGFRPVWMWRLVARYGLAPLVAELRQARRTDPERASRRTLYREEARIRRSAREAPKRHTER